MILHDEIVKAAVEMRRNGSKHGIALRQMRSLYEDAVAAYSRNPRDVQSECDWRMASLTYGAALAFKGKWADAVNAYAISPANIPSPREPVMCCRVFTALMATGRATAMMRTDNQSNAGFTAAIALRHFPTGNKAIRFRRWQGVAMLIWAEKMLPRIGESRPFGEAAATLDQGRQRELYIRARYLNRNGKGMIPRDHLFGERPATYQARECVYYFND